MLRPEVVDVNGLLATVRPKLPPLLGEQVAVTIETKASEPLVVADRDGLELAILSLAANASDAMDGCGRLTIGTSRRLAEEGGRTKARGWVVLAVTDSGPGIPPELQSQVFDPFFTTKPAGSGAGLGLAAVQGFVVQSGGKVALRSEPGHGTTVEILLPEATDGTRPQETGQP